MESRILNISGITTAHGAYRVERALNAVPDVSATVDLASGTALVCAEPQVSETALRAAVAEAGCMIVDPA